MKDILGTELQLGDFIHKEGGYLGWVVGDFPATNSFLIFKWNIVCQAWPSIYLGDTNFVIVNPPENIKQQILEAYKCHLLAMK
jgi:hypothetical protein